MDKRLIGDAKPFTASIAKELGVIGRMKLRHFPHERRAELARDLHCMLSRVQHG